jgi:prevent-host-death family protein
MTTINLYEAKTKLSALVEQAAAGEDIIIAKNGVPRARLVAIPDVRAPRKPSNTMKITYMADDFDAPDEEIIAMFEGKYSNDDWLDQKPESDAAE